MSPAPPLPAGCLAARRLGLLGGSFDPVHRGHLHLARAAQSAFELDRVLFVPAARPPHKPGVELAPDRDRLEMVRLAIRAESRWDLWAGELERDGPSFSIDTVRCLIEARAGAGQLYLLIGGDNLPGLADWHRVEELLELVQPVVVHRGQDLVPLLGALRGRLGPSALGRLEAGLVDVAPLPLAATDLRARLARGERPVGELPPDVLEYILERGIYRRR